jgi:PAS domain-containing protein
VLDDTGTTIAVNTTLDRIPALKAGGELRLGADYLASCEAAAAAGDEHRGAIAQALREMLAGDRDAFTGRYALGGSDEAPRWFGMRASRFRGAGAGCIVMEHFDKTIFVKAQQAAQLGAETVEYTDAAVLATDLHGRIALWSRGAEQLFGWSAEEVVGRDVLRLVLPPGKGDPASAVLGDLRKRGRGSPSASCGAATGRRSTRTSTASCAATSAAPRPASSPSPST